MVKEKENAWIEQAKFIMSIPLELDAALTLTNRQRPDYLTSLYHYAQMLQKPARIVEIGCYHGESTIMMACALRGTESQLITIDPVFQTGRVHVADANLPEPGSYESSLIEFLNRISRAELDGYITAIPDYSHNVLKRWDGRLIDLLFIDGEHTHSAVRNDCEWMRFVKQGGYAAFDDWMAPVEAAVQEYLIIHPEWVILHESTDPPDGNMVVTLLQKR